MFKTRASRVLTATLLLGLLSVGGKAQAAVAEVRDEAHFFSAGAVAEANDSIKEIKQRYMKDLLIETIVLVPEDKKDEANSSDEKVKGHFFANWAIQRARAQGVNGIYVLITREPGHVEVVVGNQTRTVFPDEERHRLSQLLLTHFRQKEYDEGLRAAVKDVRSVLSTAPTTGTSATAPANPNRPGHNQPTVPQPTAPQPTLPSGRARAAGGSWLPWLGVGLAILLGIWVLSAVLRALSGNQQRPIGAGFGGPGPYGGAAPYGGYGGYGGGGGGFFSNMMGGLFGAAAGSWLYDQFSGGHSHFGGQGPLGSPPTIGPTPDRPDTDPHDTGYSAEGGDFNQPAERYDDRSGSADDTSSWGSGGDFGGGDSGGDVGGGDFGGGGDTGGGDFGGGGGGDTTSGGDF
jgi:TPM domain